MLRYYTRTMRTMNTNSGLLLYKLCSNEADALQEMFCLTFRGDCREFTSIL